MGCVFSSILWYILFLMMMMVQQNIRHLPQLQNNIKNFLLYWWALFIIESEILVNQLNIKYMMRNDALIFISCLQWAHQSSYSLSHNYISHTYSFIIHRFKMGKRKCDRVSLPKTRKWNSIPWDNNNNNFWIWSKW